MGEKTRQSTDAANVSGPGLMKSKHLNSPTPQPNAGSLGPMSGPNGQPQSTKRGRHG